MDEGGHWHNAGELYVSKVGEVFFYQLLDVYLGSVKALCNIVLLQLDKHEEMEKQINEHIYAHACQDLYLDRIYLKSSNK